MQSYGHNHQSLFSNLRVIELAGVLAGPSVGFFFAELGAEVIKIENPNTGGDVTRNWKIPGENSGSRESAYYWSVNTQKSIHYLNLKTDEGKRALYDLVKKADIVITNYKQGDDIKNGVDYETLSKLCPQLIYGSINGFGNHSARTAYDLILQAESGFMSMNGTAESGPVKMPVALIDLLAAHQLKEAILIALWRRERYGLGSHVSVSLFHSAIASLANQATNWLIAHHLPQRQGSLHPNIAPYGEIFKTKDHQHLTFAIGSELHFKQLCEMLNLGPICLEPRFAENSQRVLHRQPLFDILNTAIQVYTADEIIKQCHLRQIPVGKIRNLQEVFELPEAKELLRFFEHEGKTMQTVSGIAFNFHA